jgi:ribosomal protein S12 methylthiotransferase accessory factor
MPRTPAAEALQALLPLLGALGITRLGDLTGLDRLGIPVVQTTRPASLSNIVNQGKGSTLEAAAVSAIFEAAEFLFAERIRVDTVIASADALNVPAGWFEPFLREDASPDWRDLPTAWVEAVDPLNGGACSIPLELVHTAFDESTPETDTLFEGSTLGLACGFAEEQAIRHAVLECLERDAIARAMVTHGFFQRARVDLCSIADESLRLLLARIEAAGLLIGLWYAEAITGVPVLWCHLMEKAGSAAMVLPFPADGSAAGLDPIDTARRAIEEAAQSRLTVISGARDEFAGDIYPKHPKWEVIDAHRRLLADGPRPIDFRRICDRAPQDRSLPELLAGIQEQTPLAMIRLDTAPVTSVAAVRVVAPLLQPLLV